MHAIGMHAIAIACNSYTKEMNAYHCSAVYILQACLILMLGKNMGKQKAYLAPACTFLA